MNISIEVFVHIKWDQLNRNLNFKHDRWWGKVIPRLCLTSHSPEQYLSITSAAALSSWLMFGSSVLSQFLIEEGDRLVVAADLLMAFIWTAAPFRFLRLFFVKSLWFTVAYNEVDCECLIGLDWIGLPLARHWQYKLTFFRWFSYQPSTPRFSILRWCLWRPLCKVQNQCKETFHRS